jgi:hypothetical protein
MEYHAGICCAGRRTAVKGKKEEVDPLMEKWSSHFTPKSITKSSLMKKIYVQRQRGLAKWLISKLQKAGTASSAAATINGKSRNGNVA